MSLESYQLVGLCGLELAPSCSVCVRSCCLPSGPGSCKEMALLHFNVYNLMWLKSLMDSWAMFSVTTITWISLEGLPRQVARKQEAHPYRQNPSAAHPSALWVRYFCLVCSQVLPLCSPLGWQMLRVLQVYFLAAFCLEVWHRWHTESV